MEAFRPVTNNVPKISQKVYSVVLMPFQVQGLQLSLRSERDDPCLSCVTGRTARHF